MTAGTMVRFLYQTLNGLKPRAGMVCQTIGDAVEIRMQQGGYITVPISELLPSLTTEAGQ